MLGPSRAHTNGDRTRSPFFLWHRPRTLFFVTTAQQHDPLLLLQAGAQQLALTLTSSQCAQLLAYLQLLRKWNQAMDLTAIDDPADAVSWHLLDSLAAVPYIKGERGLDVGSGAGLPGLPLAIACPARQFVLVDSRLKRSQFLLHCVAELGLDNVTVETTRVETYRPGSKFDTLFARAFAPMGQLLQQVGHLCQQKGRILIWKGARPDAELRAIKEKHNLIVEVYPITVPGLNASRHLVCVTVDA